MLNEELKLMIKNQGKNVIELDSSEESSEEESDIEETRKKLVIELMEA